MVLTFDIESCTSKNTRTLGSTNHDNDDAMRRQYAGVCRKAVLFVGRVFVAGFVLTYTQYSASKNIAIPPVHSQWCTIFLERQTSLTNLNSLSALGTTPWGERLSGIHSTLYQSRVGVPPLGRPHGPQSFYSVPLALCTCESTSGYTLQINALKAHNPHFPRMPPGLAKCPLGDSLRLHSLLLRSRGTWPP